MHLHVYATITAIRVGHVNAPADIYRRSNNTAMLTIPLEYLYGQMKLFDVHLSYSSQ